MAVYEYRGLTAAGSKSAGMVDADNPKSARLKLRKDGIFTTEIKSVTEVTTYAPGSKPLFTPSVTLSETAIMTRQLATLLGAGIPLLEAMTALTEQVEKGVAQKVCAEVRDGIQEGMSFATALSLHPKVFSSLYCQMIRVGEETGTLTPILQRLADHIEKQVRLKRQLTSVLTYPILMMGVSGLILIFLLTYVVPKVTIIFSDLNRALPLPTRILLSISDFAKHDGWMLVVAFIACGIWVKRRWQTPAGRMQYEGWLLQVPLIGQVMRKSAISRFTKTLSSLLASGIPLLKSLGIVQKVVNNLHLEQAIEEAQKNIKAGESIAIPLKRSGLFPPMVTHMIAIGERSGELEGMLLKVSEAYDNEVETIVASLAALLSPLLILVMGAIVLFIVLAILLPIFEMSQIV